MKSREQWALVAGVIVFLLGAAVALLLGPSLSELSGPERLRIFQSVRLPEALTALVVGGTLGLSGLLFQLSLRNPLADPFVMGVAGGATFGGVLVLVLGGAALGWAGLPARGGAAFAGGVLTLWLLLRLSRGRVVVLLLGGVVANAAFSGMARAMAVWLSPDELSMVLAVLTGFIPSPRLWEPLLIAIPAAYVMVRFARRGRGLDLLLFSDAEATSLGLDVHRTRKEALLAATLLAASAVTLCGMIGFVGLAAPHAAKALAGARHRTLVPLSFLLGGGALALAHGFSKGLANHFLLPVGIYTTLAGAPVFLWLLLRQTQEEKP